MKIMGIVMVTVMMMIMVMMVMVMMLMVVEWKQLILAKDFLGTRHYFKPI
jgi:hypothetical protein